MDCNNSSGFAFKCHLEKFQKDSSDFSKKLANGISSPTSFCNLLSEKTNGIVLAEVPSKKRNSKEVEEGHSDNKKSKVDEEEIASQHIGWLTSALIMITMTFPFF